MEVVKRHSMRDCREEARLEPLEAKFGGCDLTKSIRTSLHVHNQPLSTNCIGPQNTVYTFLLKKAPSNSTNSESKSEH